MLPDENAVSFNLQTTGALKQRKRAIELLEARELFKSVEWLVEAEQPSLSAQGFGNKGGEEGCRGQNFVQQATAFQREFRRKVHNFRKCAGLLVAQITSLTEGYLLLSEDPVQGGKMEWSQEEEGKGRTVGKERPRTTWCRTLARRSSKEGGGPRGRAREKIPHHSAGYRTTRSRVPPTVRRVAPGNRGRPNGPRARPHESRPLALSRHGPGRRTLLAVCPPSPPRPPSPRQASPPTSAEGCASPLALPLHDWSLHSDERSHVIGPPPH
ncbi:hypothetical protein G5I_06751 [Acromyrmex echinatior]|uniref:Uncharacterized protein n=1 Tax=Acromyrmex echinatior TaxID=103372 RepID=F4WLW9_ACREC|nr:hypothetical protein G5I_06751 [Acromyrmex echinatior]